MVDERDAQIIAEPLDPTELEEAISADRDDRSAEEWDLIELAAEKWLSCHDNDLERAAADLWRSNNPQQSVFDCDEETKALYRRLALEHSIQAQAASAREKVAVWMIERSYATGHGERDAQIIAEQQARELLGRAKSACDNRPDCECARDDEGYLRICEWDVTLVAAALRQSAASAREKALREAEGIARGHIDKRLRKFSVVSLEAIRDEDRGEDIAALIIADAIAKLKGHQR